MAEYEGKVHSDGPDTQVVESGGLVRVKEGGRLLGDVDAPVFSRRFRKTIAEVNAGVELLPAIAGYKYRPVNMRAVAVGGAAAAVTTVDVLGTQGTASVKLVAFAQASLTQSAVLTAGGTGAAVLADGASFTACDANTAITAGKTGADITTATHIDFLVEYVVEEA